MKINFLIVAFIAILLTSCAPRMPAQTIEVPTQTALPEVSLTEMPVTLEPLIKDVPTLTKIPTLMPSPTQPGCMALLTPLDGVEIPATGQLTFSWESVQDVSSYVLNITMPSGTTISFETDEPFRRQYMEAFSPGGSYQWNVTAIGNDRKRTVICTSEPATFSKQASAPPPQAEDETRKKKK